MQNNDELDPLRKREDLKNVVAELETTVKKTNQRGPCCL